MPNVGKITATKCVSKAGKAHYTQMICEYLKIKNKVNNSLCEVL